MPPTTAEIVIGCTAVILGCMAAAATFAAARQTGNWLYWLCALGSTLFVFGVIGQQVFPAPTLSVPGLWQAGVSLPLLGLRVTPVAVGGLMLAALGLSLVLLFEAPRPARTVVIESAGPTEELDSI
jgi:hypothetical protein